MSKKIILISIFTLFVNYTFSQTTTTTTSKHFSSDGQYYNGTVRGLSLYMKSLETDDNDLYKVLEPEFLKIKQKRNIALGVGITAYSIGLGLGAYGLNKNINSPNFDEGIGAMVASPIFILGGLLASFIITPNKQDYLNFINIHNKNSLNRKLQFNIGYIPTDINNNNNYCFNFTYKF